MDAYAYKQLMKNHPGAPVVIATGGAGERTGMTATAFCSLSDSPPTILICVNKSASAHAVIRDTKSFSVNVLSAEQQDVAAQFAGQTGLKGEARFASGTWITQVTGAPVMADALGNLDCTLLDEHDHGTHSVFVGLVKAVRSAPSADPLIYFQGIFRPLTQRVPSACTA